MKEDLQIRIRKIDPRHSLVFDTWIRFYAASNSLPRAAVDAGARKAIERILTRPSTEVRAAVDASNPDKIFGIAVIDQAKILHWIYTKKEYRGFGITRTLLSDLSDVRVWWLGRNVNYIARVTRIVYEPLLLCEM